MLLRSAVGFWCFVGSDQADLKVQTSDFPAAYLAWWVVHYMAGNPTSTLAVLHREAVREFGSTHGDGLYSFEGCDFKFRVCF
jgi:hypothetical protein